MKLFQQSTFNKAIEYINFLKKRNKTLSKTFSKIFKKRTSSRIQKIPKFLKEDYKNKLEPTNNKLENYNGNTMPKYEKKILYKTMQGLWSALIHKKEGGLKEEIKT